MPVGLVNGARCTFWGLTWLPGDKNDVINKFLRGTLVPKPDGSAYDVPAPYTVNVKFTNKWDYEEAIKAGDSKQQARDKSVTFVTLS